MGVSDVIREYGGVVWTNHALERLNKRRIHQSDALAVLKKPERTYPGKKDNSVKFIRTINGRRMHVVAAMDEAQKKWVVMSVWVRGEDDRRTWYERLVLYIVDQFVKLVIWVFRKIFGKK